MSIGERATFVATITNEYNGRHELSADGFEEIVQLGINAFHEKYGCDEVKLQVEDVDEIDREIV